MRLVVLSEVKWGYMRTRKRFLIAHFPDHWQVLFIEPMNRSARSHFWPRRDGRVTVATLPVLKPSTTIAALNRLLEWAIVRRALEALVTLWLSIALSVWGRGRPRVFYLSNVLLTPSARHVHRDLLVYDCNDDPLGFRTTPAWVERYVRATLATADRVVSCSRALGRRLESRGARAVQVIGNGVDFDRFAGPVDPSRVDERLAALPRPRIGYAGAISNWFDFDLVEAVAGAYPGQPVVLMGPIAADVRARAEALARAQPNVVFTGTIPYEDLPHHVGSLDVCLIPFLIGGETDVLNPNKLYEYLAAGRSVVSLAYSEDIEDFHDVIWIAPDREAFVACVGEALAAPRDPDALREIARAHSWRAQAASFVALIESALGQT